MNFEVSNYDHSNSSSTVTLLYSNEESYKLSLNNKCLNSLNYLNQVRNKFCLMIISLKFFVFEKELVNLGFNSIFLNDDELNLTSNSITNILSIDFGSLILTIIEFIKRYCTQLPVLEKLQDQ
jgi:hypothetical protein